MRIEKLSTICDVKNGYAFKSGDYREFGHRVIRITNVQKGIVVDDNPQFIPDEIADKVSSFKLMLGDILISLTGNVGRVGRIQDCHLPAVLNQRVGLIRLTSKDINDEYLFQYLNSDRFEKDAIKNSNGVAQLNLSSKWVENHSIPLPPLDDQLRIALLLGKVGALIARRKENLQHLDELLKSVFLEMFGDPVRNEKGWDTLPFNKVGQFKSGGTPSKNRDDYWSGNFPWVSPKDMKVPKISDSEDHISESVFEETSLKRILPQHLLIVVRGMILAHSFPVAINTVEVAINQDMKAIKLKKDLEVVYLLHCLNSLKRQILKLISTAGHGTKKFDSNAMEKLFIPTPPPELQKHFSMLAEKVEGIKSQYQQSLTELENLYGVLSQKAFKGDLDLSRVPLPVESTTK